MKIAICASMSAANKIVEVQSVLVTMGHEVIIPVTTHLHVGTNANKVESVSDKIHGDFMRAYFKKIQSSDAVLALNEAKNGIENYIGGNTLIELAFAHVLEKRCYIYNDIPNLSYTDEILACQPIVLEGDLSKIK